MIGFAWVGPTETTFTATHDREDEKIVGFQLDHSEGDFPMLSVEIRNPRRQLLSGDAIWCWLSRDGAPLFFGRLVAIPEEMEAEIVRLNFIARPVGYMDAKRALADTLRVAPYWDPVWITDERVDDPDVVLEARTQIWHIDRVSHAVTVSDIVAGEDGTLALGDGDFVYESLDVRYGSPPIRTVRVDAEVSWDQTAAGELDISQPIRDAFGGLVSSYTGQGLQEDWPREGLGLGGGWHVVSSELTRVDGVSGPAVYQDVSVAALTATTDSDAEAVYSQPFQARFYRWDFTASMTIGYDVRRPRKERVRFDLVGDVQRVFTEPGEEEELVLGLASQKISQRIDEGLTAPIGDPARNSYFPTDRGRRSLEYLIALAKAKIMARARAVEVRVTIPLPDALGLSCRQSVTITDSRLPGGTATGKIVAYRIVAGGDGAQYGEVVLGCTIGMGAIISGTTGDPAYAEGYSDSYQVMTGETHDVGLGVTYEDLSGVPIRDDGVNFSDMTAANNITSLTVTNGASVQSGVLSASFADIPAVIEELNRAYTEVWLELRPLATGPFESWFNVAVSNLSVPQTIAL